MTASTTASPAPTEQETANYTAYLAWLHDEVEKYCDSDGRYPVYWNYDDTIAPDDFIKAYQHFDNEGFTSPRSYLEDIVMGYVRPDEQFYESLLNDLNDADDAVHEAWDMTESVWDDLEKCGYTGIDLDFESLLNRVDLKVNLMFATAKEADYDMSSIVDAFGNDYRDPDLASMRADALDNALTYLVHQQGHPLMDVYDALKNGQSDNSFIESVRLEIAENNSECMSEIAVCVQLSGAEMLDLMERLDRDAGAVSIDTDATIGIFNQWSGCGSILDIQPERAIVMPMAMLREFSIEGQNEVPGAYTVDSVYGLIPACWKPSLTILDEAPQRIIDENLDNVAAALHARARKTEATK